MSILFTRLFISILCIIFVTGTVWGVLYFRNAISQSGAPPYATEDLEPPVFDPFGLKNWTRPVGPVRIGLQVGHWKNEDLPEELSRLRGSTGAHAAGNVEWEVNLAIAEATAAMLESNGVVVDILPATVPEKYIADAFIAIHADGNANTNVYGFKITGPRRDRSGKASQLADAIDETYAAATQLERDPNISRNMLGYYAFAWWRYTHAVHPMTPSVILETGFLTNPADRAIIVEQPERSAQGIANGVMMFLKNQQLL